METNNTPKFCTQCGNRLPANVVFCPACGAKMDPTVPLDEPAPPRKDCATSNAQTGASPTVDYEDKTAATSNHNNSCIETNPNDALKKRSSCLRSLVTTVLVLVGFWESYGLFLLCCIFRRGGRRKILRSPLPRGQVF